MDIRYVLASGSPRRKELIKKILPEFEVITADIDERAIEMPLLEQLRGLPMQDVSMRISTQLALAKARAVYEKLGRPGNTVVIGADTSVALPDEILGKPKDRADAVRMLRKESLTPQYVLTGVALVGLGRESTFAESSKVFFNRLDAVQEQRIQDYCDTDDPYDKAGAYGIQAYKNTLVDYYEGDFDNIVGLPAERLKKELKKFIRHTAGNS